MIERIEGELGWVITQAYGLSLARRKILRAFANDT